MQSTDSHINLRDELEQFMDKFSAERVESKINANLEDVYNSILAKCDGNVELLKECEKYIEYFEQRSDNIINIGETPDTFVALSSSHKRYFIDEDVHKTLVLAYSILNEVKTSLSTILRSKIYDNDMTRLMLKYIINSHA